MGRKKGGNCVVEEGHTGGAQTQRMGGDVNIASHNPRLQLGGPVSPVSQASQGRFQVSQEEDYGTGVGPQSLLEAKVSGLCTEISLFQEFQLPALPGVVVRAWGHPVHGVYDQVRLGQPKAEVGGHGRRRRYQ